MVLGFFRVLLRSGDWLELMVMLWGFRQRMIWATVKLVTMRLELDAFLRRGEFMEFSLPIVITISLSGSVINMLSIVKL